ncbi:hypothetical protein [Mesorhizobium sp.]|uniref:hypothetical protein n=1 Tax=Mesorhizobium sp. TaxID=1871066 RepID=UPI00257F243A|nr:hypothetical protein [Mesorhizobium sp.]
MSLAIVDVGAAPHCPAGHFSPHSDGEKEAGRSLGAYSATSDIGETIDDSAPLPVTIRGEDAGRQVRGGAKARIALAQEISGLDGPKDVLYREKTFGLQANIGIGGMVASVRHIAPWP